jgi:hypothetical protein
MVQITVSEELARAITEAGSVVTLVDSRGRALAHATPVEHTQAIGITEEHLREVERRMANDDGTRYTWAEVKEYLHTLAPE